ERKLIRAFKSVDNAEGLNNHMGSKATEDTRTMEYVMEYLHENNIFFLDSQTSRESAGYSISQKKGVRGAVITGYIDVEDKKEYIEKRLDILIQHAEENGSAIILGHDRPNTISVLEKKLPEYEGQGIQFVRVSDLVY
ncbi:divergent polysaccharide deacetylase family protein, partial [Candidatus Latescibacterota bacterium]